MPTCNSTLSETHWNEENVIGNMSLHTLGWVICGLCSIIASFTSFYLIWKHATHYQNPAEQRHIIRILLMIPIYAWTSCLSYVWYWHAVYWEVGRDCYEAFAIAAFFILLCQFIEPDLRTQKEYFAILTPKPWPWPMNWINKCFGDKIKAPRSGLTWFNIIWLGVFQYCFIRVAMTITAMATQTVDLYCEDSLSPAFAHSWVMAFDSIAVTIAMYCLLAFYFQLKNDLARNSPMLKLLCIKLVIFFSFWQTTILSFLCTARIVKPTQYLSYGDISVGINSLLTDVEMILFSIMHLWAFPWKVYAIHEGQYDNVMTRTNVFTGLIDAFNPLDTVKAVGRALRWLFIGRKVRNQEAQLIVARKDSKYRKPTEQHSDEDLGLVGAASEMGVMDPYHGDAYQMGNTINHPAGPSDPHYRPNQSHSPNGSDGPDLDDPYLYSAPAVGGGAAALPVQQPAPQRPHPANPFSDDSALPYPEQNAMMPSVVTTAPALERGFSQRRKPVGSAPDPEHHLLSGGSSSSSTSSTPNRGRSPAGGGAGGGRGMNY